MVQIRTSSFRIELTRLPRPQWLPSPIAGATLLAAHTKLY